MEDLKKYEEDFFLFLEAGFIAINQADEDSAVKLLKTCELMQPENPLIKIGFGYLHLHKLELKQALIDVGFRPKPDSKRFQEHRSGVRICRFVVDSKLHRPGTFDDSGGVG